jgi:hypothetical protein
MNLKPITSIDQNMVKPHEPAILPNPGHHLGIDLTVGLSHFDVKVNVVVVPFGVHDDVVDLSEDEAVEVV